MDLFDFNDNEESAKPLGRTDARQQSGRIYRPETHRVRAFPAPPRHRLRSAGELYFLGPARLRKDHPRQHHRPGHERGIYQAQRRQRGRGGRQEGGGDRAGKPQIVRQAHLSPSGRVPSLQQDPERFSPSRHRTGDRHLHRLHDGKSVRFDDPRHRSPAAACSSFAGCPRRTFPGRCMRR